MKSPFLFVLLLLSSPALSLAEEVSPPTNPRQQFETQFAEVLRNFNENDYANGFNKLGELSSEAERLGYVNLPDYSRKLLDFARVAQSPEHAGFLVRRAVELSPTVPGVNFDAATFFDQVGSVQALSYAWNGVHGLFLHPISLVYVGSYVLIAALSAFTLALFVVCVAQLVVRARRLIFALANLIPVRIRGAGSALLLLAVMMGPLCAGIFGALGIWALVLSRYVKGCKWFGVLAGALIVCWTLILPIIQRLNLNAYQPLNVAVENVLTQTFSSKDESILENVSGYSASTRIYLYAAGQNLFQHRDYDRARSYFERVLTGRRTRLDSLGIAALTALGVLEYRSARYEKAKEYFERAEAEGSSEFALYYNMSLTQLALVDTKGHQLYYEKAKAADAGRLSRLESESQTESSSDMVWSVYPTWSFFGHLLQPLPGLMQAEQNGVTSRDAVYRALFPIKGWWTVLSWGGLIMLMGFLNLLKFERRKARIELSSEHRSVLWAVVPAGFYASGDRPNWGVFAMSLLFAFVIIGLGEPKWGLKGVAPVLMVQNMSLIVAVVLFILFSAIGLRKTS